MFPEPTGAQQGAIDKIRRHHDTVACAPYLPMGTRTWVVAAFERLDAGDEWQEVKRWRILPNGDVYDVLPGTPSANQRIDAPNDEPVAGDLSRLESDDIEDMLAYGREHGIPALLDHLGLDEFGNEVARLLEGARA